MTRTAKHAIIVLQLLSITACASSSLFKSYPSQAINYQKAIITDDYTASLASLEGKRNKADNLLYMQESGRLNQLHQDFNSSKNDFDFVIRRYQDIDEQARVSAAKLSAQAASLFSNENAVPYHGAAYERIMALQLQAFNYLALGDAQGAAVEIRRAAIEQRRLELENAKAIEAIEEQSNQESIDASAWQNDPNLLAMSQQSNSLRNSILNAYSYYSSAVFWEASGNYNDALVDYKKALTIQPNNSQLQADIKRTSALQENPYQNKDMQQGNLVILFEEGFIPAKRGFTLTLPSFNFDTIFSIAVPFYSLDDIQSPAILHVSQNGHSLGQSQVLVELSALAIKHLHEQMPALILRQFLRAKAKYELQQQAMQQSELAGFFTSIYNIVSEQADLRSWLSLPNSAQSLRLELSVGKHSLELNSQGASTVVEVEIRPAATTLLRVVKTGGRYTINPFML